MNEEPLQNNSHSTSPPTQTEPPLGSPRPKFVTEVVGEVPSQPQQPTQNMQAQPSEQVKIDPHAPGSHVEIPGNKPHNPHVLQKLFFLIPAILIVITIAGVAFLTRKDFVIREDTHTIEPLASALPTIEPAATIVPEVKTKIFSNDLFSFSYSENLNLFECGEQLYLTQIITQREAGISLEEDFCIDPDSFDNVISIEIVDKDVNIAEDAQTRLILAGEQNLIITLLDEKFTDEFNSVLKSLEILVDLTADWEIFENTGYGYSIKYPPSWNLVNAGSQKDKIGPRSHIRKSLEETKLQNLIIEVQLGLKNASLTASETASSTKSLLGWKAKPETQIISVGGSNAQIVRGEFDGNWVEYIVVWYKDVVVQMTWTDFPSRENQKVFDDMLESFKLL